MALDAETQKQAIDSEAFTSQDQDTARKMGRRAALLAAGMGLIAVACDDTETASDDATASDNESGRIAGDDFDLADSPSALGFVSDSTVPPGEGVPAPEPVVEPQIDNDIVDNSLVRPAREDSAPVVTGNNGIAGPVLRGPLTVDPADICLLYTSPSPRDQRGSRMPSSA